MSLFLLKYQRKCSRQSFGRFEDTFGDYVVFDYYFVVIIVSAAAEALTAEKTDTVKIVESTTQSTSGIEDLFKDSSSVTQAPSVAPEKPQKDVKNDIMSLFEKVRATTIASIG